MLKDLLLFLLMMAGGAYGLWIMRGVDGFMKRRRKRRNSEKRVCIYRADKGKSGKESRLSGYNYI